MRILPQCARAAGWWWWVAVAAELLGSAAALARPACAAVLVDGALAGQVAWGAGLALAGTWSLRLAAGSAAEHGLTRAAEGVQRLARQWLTDRADDPAAGCLRHEVDRFAALVVRPPVEVLAAVVRMAGAAALLAWLHPTLLLALAPVAVVLPVVLLLGRRWAAAVARQQADLRAQVRQRWSEAKSLPLQRSWLGPAVADLQRQESVTEVRLATMTAWSAPVAYGLLTLGVALVLIPGADAVRVGTLTAGGLTSGVFLVILALGPLVEVLAGSARWWQVAALAARWEALAAPRSSGAAPADAWRPWGATVTGPAQVRWPAGGSLDLPTLRLAPGDKVAIAGPSGAGKSTVLRCLAGEMALARGLVEVDGRRPAPGPGGIVVLEQGCRCPAATARDLWRAVGLTEAATQALAQDLGLADVVQGSEEHPAEQLPDETRQAVLLMAAVAVRPRLLLLDEATSALPVATASRVLAALHRRGMTLVVVAHRPAEVAGWPTVILSPS